jgi:uncharacterized membrane protein
VTNLKPVVLGYLGTAIAFCALDFAWLSVMAPRFYHDQVGALLRDTPQWQSGLAFYLLYVIGLMVFCVLPARRTENAGWRRAACLGALFGLVAYGTYDLSNLATLKGWTMPLTLVDMTWGAVASAVASTCGYFSVKFFAHGGK